MTKDLNEKILKINDYVISYNFVYKITEIVDEHVVQVKRITTDDNFYAFSCELRWISEDEISFWALKEPDLR